MQKTFCDICGSELTDQTKTTGGRVPGRMGVKIESDGAQFAFEVIPAVNGLMDKGDICKYCVLDALNKLDDRPRYA